MNLLRSGWRVAAPDHGFKGDANGPDLGLDSRMPGLDALLQPDRGTFRRVRHLDGIRVVPYSPDYFFFHAAGGGN